MPAPTKLPWRTSYGATLIWICSIAASEIGATFVRSPGPPPRPNELFRYEPSTVMLLKRPSVPAIEQPVESVQPPEYGLRRVTDSSRPEIVGSEASAWRLTCVDAPVRSELMIAPRSPVTVIPEISTACVCDWKARS